MQWKISASRKKKFKVISFLISALLTLLTSTLAKPTLHRFPSLSSYKQKNVEPKNVDQMKAYSGIRLRNDSLIMIYHHDQTVAVVELGPQKLLLNCELIEIYNELEGVKLLHDLSRLNQPLKIGLMEMVKLMEQCDTVDRHRRPYGMANGAGPINENINNGGLFSQSPLTLANGIIPGTKWCGAGDIASSYVDLGTETNMDRCCRAHDLCPVKVRAYKQRYNLSNDSFYTKSHCVCDDILFSCLKATNTSAAKIMGSIYFNLVQVPCVQDTPNGRVFRKAREGF